MSEKLEQKTLEFRQRKISEWVGDHLLYYYKVQQKWLVATDEPIYEASRSLNKSDIWLEELPYLVYPSRHKWQPAKEEWKDLPEINHQDDLNPQS